LSREPECREPHHRKAAMICQLLALIMLCSPRAFAQGAQADSLGLRTRDQHQNLLVVADPYLRADRYKASFGKNTPYDAGIIAIDVYFRNDNDSPIRLNLDTIRLVISLPGEERQRLAALSPDEVADRALLKVHLSAPRRPLSFPGLGSKSGKGKAWDEMATSLGSVALLTDVLPPHATTHGFLYFDMNYHFDAIEQSRIYIPDLSFMTDHKALLFFEIDLSSSAN
jgi:hypothetical protein